MVSGFVRRINKNIVKVDDNADIEHVHEDVVHKALKRRGSVGKSFWHYTPFEGSITRAKGGFPFVTFTDANEMVGVGEVYLGVDTRFTWRIQKVRNKRKRIAVLFEKFVTA